MAFITKSYLTYRNVCDELCMLITNQPPSKSNVDFRRILKEAQNLLLNEATVSPDSVETLVFEGIPRGGSISLPEEYDSIVEAWSPSGKKYHIIDRAMFESNTWFRSEYPKHDSGYHAIMLDMGLNEQNLRTYSVLSGSNGINDNPTSNVMTVSARCALRGLSLNIYDDAAWEDKEVRIYPGCLPALKAMMLAVVYNEQGNTQMGTDSYGLAVKYLNDHLRKYRQGTYQAPNIIQNGGIMQCPGLNLM